MDGIQSMSDTERKRDRYREIVRWCFPSSCLWTCLSACLPACQPACLPSYLPASLHAYLLSLSAYLLVVIITGFGLALYSISGVPLPARIVSNLGMSSCS